MQAKYRGQEKEQEHDILEILKKMDEKICQLKFIINEYFVFDDDVRNKILRTVIKTQIEILNNMQNILDEKYGKNNHKNHHKNHHHKNHRHNYDDRNNQNCHSGHDRNSPRISPRENSENCPKVAQSNSMPQLRSSIDLLSPNKPQIVHGISFDKKSRSEPTISIEDYLSNSRNGSDFDSSVENLSESEGIDKYQMFKMKLNRNNGIYGIISEGVQLDTYYLSTNGYNGRVYEYSYRGKEKKYILFRSSNPINDSDIVFAKFLEQITSDECIYAINNGDSQLSNS